MGSAQTSRTSGSRRTRRPLPALIVLIVLVISAVVVWQSVFADAQSLAASQACNQPGVSKPTTPPTSSANESDTTTAPMAQTQSGSLGTVLSRDALDKTDPAPLSAAQFRVFNASTQRNEGTFVSTSLAELGFKQAEEPKNDPFYPAQDMLCHGQLRFGTSGAGAARTLSIIEPCFELVQDNRQDAVVDVVIGKKFKDIKPNNAAREVMDELAWWEAQQPKQPGGPVPEGLERPTVNPEHMAAARNVQC